MTFDVTAFYRELDTRFQQSLASGEGLRSLPISDWGSFLQGFAARHAPVKGESRRMRWMVAEKIQTACWRLGWDLPYLMERGYLVFSYEQVQKNLSLSSLLARLEADGVIYLAAQMATQAAAAQSVEGQPEKAKTTRYWDDWDCWSDTGLRPVSDWDIQRVNGISADLQDLITYLTLFGSETETGSDPHGYAQVVADAIPVLTDFQAYFPTFCALLNEANVLDLTEKVIIEEPIELAITLPEVSGTASETTRSSANLWRPLARVHKQNAVTDFQGFCIGIVLEPRAEDDRDLDNCYMSAEEIEKACDHWSVHHQKIRVNHDAATEAGAFDHPDFRCIRNWIEYGSPIIGGYQIRPGTWLQAYQAVSEKGMAMLQNYEINGISPAGDVNVWKDPPKEAA